MPIFPPRFCYPNSAKNHSKRFPRSPRLSSAADISATPMVGNAKVSLNQSINTDTKAVPIFPPRFVIITQRNLTRRFPRSPRFSPPQFSLQLPRRRYASAGSRLRLRRPPRRSQPSRPIPVGEPALVGWFEWLIWLVGWLGWFDLFEWLID